MTPISTRTAVVAAKQETTIGTSVSLAAANAGFRVMNPVCKQDGRSAVIPAGTGNADIGTVTKQYSAILNFDIMAYGGTWRHLFLPTCGFDDTALTDTFLFTDDTTKWKSLTGGCFYGSSAKRGIFGAMGSFSAKFPTAQAATFSFRYKGLWLPNPGTLPTGITWDLSTPPAFTGASAYTIGGDTTEAITNLSIVSDDYVSLVPSPNGTGGFLNAWLKKPNFRIQVDPRTKAAKDWLADWIGDATTTIGAVLNGGTGNTIAMSASVAQVTAPDAQEDDEQMVTPLEFAVLNNSLQFVFS